MPSVLVTDTPTRIASSSIAPARSRGRRAADQIDPGFVFARMIVLTHVLVLVFGLLLGQMGR